MKRERERKKKMRGTRNGILYHPSYELFFPSGVSQGQLYHHQILKKEIKFKYERFIRIAVVVILNEKERCDSAEEYLFTSNAFSEVSVSGLLICIFWHKTMSNLAFRDSVVVVIDTGRTSIRAGHGLHDLLRPPSVVR